jgi:predicted O-linked N-acetylglucosamine transferase (SPINDLY family)
VKRPDEVMERFKSVADGWRSIVGVTDEAAAEMIRRDEIDILVLLAGRFDDNRPLIAAYQAAPVQVSFHDPATSGLRFMDYLITDSILSPRETREQFTERLVHLPTFYVHAPLVNAPAVNLLPARGKGYVTFGSFNNPSKVNARVVALWSRVLHAVPGSRLVLKYQNIFGNVSVRQSYFDLFIAQGIEAHRLDLISASDSSEQHMARYAAIDIGLDTFPFTGSTTTFEALWMGVPVITLLGDRMVARWSGAMLKKLRLDELIAQDEAEYVKIAQGLAQDLDRLESLRASLRERVAKSPLCDEKRRTNQIEKAYRWMWAKWCVEQAAG